MQRVTKRILCSILVITLLVGLVPEYAINVKAATTTYTSGNYEYVLNKNENNNLDIPDDAICYNGHYYMLYQDSLAWDEANLYCQQMGGHLLTITSQEEQDFINSCLSTSTKLKNLYWIGLEEVGKGWSWVTQEDYGYENWAIGEPNNDFSGTEGVVQIYGKDHSSFRVGQWNDSRYNGGTADFWRLSNTGFICEWDGKVKELGAKTSTTHKTYQTTSAYQAAYRYKMPHSWMEFLSVGKDGIDFSKSFAQPGVITTNYTNDDKTYKNSGNYIPQGICYAGDSKKTKKYRIISAYNAEAKKYPSVFYVMEQEGNSADYTYRTTLVLNEEAHTHNGGVAFDGENLWVCGPYLNEDISYIRYATLEQAIQKAKDEGVHSVLVSYDNEEPIHVAKHPSFLTYAHNKLWIGNYFGKGETKKGVLIGYEIQNKKSAVSLSESVFVNNLPSSSQGAYIDGNDLYVSSSYGSTKMSSTSRIARYSVPGLKENRIRIQLGQPEVVHEVPKMNEEILIDGNTIYTVFESSANKWMNARLITDRVLAFNKSLWTGKGIRSQKMLTSYLAVAQRSAGERYEEGTEEIVPYQYDFNEELDEREKVFTFIPSESGTYKITLAGLEAEDDLYAHLEIEDEDVCTYGVLSTCADEGAAREEREPVAGAEVEAERVEVENGTSEKSDYVGTEAEGEFVLSEGITYYFSMYVDSLSSADAFSGQYTFKAERVGGLEVQELSGTDKTVVTGLNDEMNYIRFVAKESGYYRICNTLSSGVEMGGLRVMKDFKEEIALNDDCVYLDKGEEYYILFDIEGLIDSETIATVWMEPYTSDILKADETLSVSGSSVLEYVAEEDGEVIVYSSSKNDNPTVFVYDEDGNLVSCSTNSGYDLSGNENDFAAVFTAEKGKKYRIIINSENGSQMEIRIGDYEEVTNPEPTLEPTAEPALTPEPTASQAPNATKKPSVSKSTPKTYIRTSPTVKAPGKVNLKKVKALGKQKVKVSWKWSASQDGYQLQYAMNRSFTKKQKKQNKSTMADTATIKKLKKGKTYYFRVRAYRKTSYGGKKYGKWSNVRKIKVK